MNVLSLFNGMNCGYLALERAGIPVNLYLSSEIDKYTNIIAQKNYPQTVQLGDVRNIKQMIENNLIGHVDLLIAGSPCQGFSSAGKQLAFDDPRSALFFEFVNILNVLREKNPNIKFLLENVKMKKEYRDIITMFLGVEPMQINSNLVSAQNRVRDYWFNWEVEQPEDKQITTAQIIDHSDMSVNSNGWQKWWKENSEWQLKKQYSCVMNNGRKAICMTARQVTSYNGNLVNHINGLRFLNCIEAERLQTLPDNYSEGVSNSQRYKMLGNGWTVDVIAHILRGLKCNLN